MAKAFIVVFCFLLCAGVSMSCNDCFVRYLDNYEYKTMTAPTNSEFSYTASCYKYNCNCHCSGSYSCAPRVFDCPCQECELDASKQPGEWFEMIRGCNKDMCRCHCEGGYTCGKIEKIC